MFSEVKIRTLKERLDGFKFIVTVDDDMFFVPDIMAVNSILMTYPECPDIFQHIKLQKKK